MRGRSAPPGKYQSHHGGRGVTWLWGWCAPPPASDATDVNCTSQVVGNDVGTDLALYSSLQI